MVRSTNTRKTIVQYATNPVMSVFVILKMKAMKIKDLPKNATIGGVKVRVPPEIKAEIHEGYWKSQWGYENGKAGVWLTKKLGDARVYPICIDSLAEVLEWEII
jgi:hypothetical protein